MSEESNINVGLIEDQLLFRKGLKAILSSWENLTVVFESEEGYTVIDKLRAAQKIPDVMLVDYSLPPQGEKPFTGREVVIALRDQFPDIKVVILSGHDDANFIAASIENGAHGYLVKDCDPEEVYEAVTSVFFKGSYINERALKALQRGAIRKDKPVTPVGPIQITKREEDVLELVCQQLTAEEIAEKLFISVKTVNGHRTNLLEKTGAKNVAGLVIYAIKNNIVKI